MVEVDLLGAAGALDDVVEDIIIDEVMPMAAVAHNHLLEAILAVGVSTVSAVGHACPDYVVTRWIPPGGFVLDVGAVEVFQNSHVFVG